MKFLTLICLYASAVVIITAAIELLYYGERYE